MARSKQTSGKMAALASKVLRGYEPSRDEIESLAASVLVQRELAITAINEIETLKAQQEISSDVKPIAASRKGFWGNLFKK